ncbi:N-acetylmuramoyl-L-alanine amidase [Planococcus halotolerans]|uniref:N-acetylmuramoyl-L-alanine amidase n=1 Tax=Planococcus halotolerans TaxID=2233542 RepID=A0A365L5P7_9BACL|nr:N-acetylmuramoyl-L-alanine amidase [Planococcus halotolerans]QHJ70527.1 SH3 domain-containing protein [Planococcus halotolerans]RAZ80746.1 N-acetylmuramoyl-L-alanine amidase [Planococcus halotolerans]
MNSFFSKVTLFLVAAVLVISSIGVSPASAATPFKDVPANDAQITYLYERNLISGISTTQFGPDYSVTREQAATMIGRSLKLNGTKRTTKFPDVSPSSYSSGYIQSAVEKGFISGYPDGSFRPKQPMTRGEMAHMISRAFNFTQTSAVFFKDIKVDNDPTSLYSATNKLATAGITAGTGGGYYTPDKTLIRQEFAMFLARALEPKFRVLFQNATIDKLYSTTDNLNVRSGPSTSYNILGKIHTNNEVQVYGYSGNWVYGKSGSLTGYFSLSYLAKATAQPSRVMVIDAGHGGSDPGAVANGLREKDVNLDVSLRVERMLKAKGINVLMVRRTDVFYSLDYRAAYGVKNGADAFVSIHANAASAGVSGSETFYSASVANDSKQLATFIQNRLYKAMEHTNRGVKEYDYRVIAANPLPAALVELGFLTNSGDAAKLATWTYKERAASAIAEGIEDYYEWKER